MLLKRPILSKSTVALLFLIGSPNGPGGSCGSLVAGGPMETATRGLMGEAEIKPLSTKNLHQPTGENDSQNCAFTLKLTKDKGFQVMLNPLPQGQRVTAKLTKDKGAQLILDPLPEGQRVQPKGEPISSHRQAAGELARNDVSPQFDQNPKLIPGRIEEVTSAPDQATIGNTPSYARSPQQSRQKGQKKSKYTNQQWHAVQNSNQLKRPSGHFKQTPMVNKLDASKSFPASSESNPHTSFEALDITGISPEALPKRTNSFHGGSTEPNFMIDELTPEKGSAALKKALKIPDSQSGSAPAPHSMPKMVKGKVNADDEDTQGVRSRSNSWNSYRSSKKRTGAGRMATIQEEDPQAALLHEASILNGKTLSLAPGRMPYILRRDDPISPIERAKMLGKLFGLSEDQVTVDPWVMKAWEKNKAATTSDQLNPGTTPTIPPPKGSHQLPKDAEHKDINAPAVQRAESKASKASGEVALHDTGTNRPHLLSPNDVPPGLGDQQSLQAENQKNLDATNLHPNPENSKIESTNPVTHSIFGDPDTVMKDKTNQVAENPKLYITSDVSARQPQPAGGRPLSPTATSKPSILSEQSTGNVAPPSRHLIPDKESDYHVQFPKVEESMERDNMRVKGKTIAKIPVGKEKIPKEETGPIGGNVGFGISTKEIHRPSSSQSFKAKLEGKKVATNAPDSSAHELRYLAEAISTEANKIEKHVELERTALSKTSEMEPNIPSNPAMELPRKYASKDKIHASKGVPVSADQLPKSKNRFKKQNNHKTLLEMTMLRKEDLKVSHQGTPENSLQHTSQISRSEPPMADKASINDMVSQKSVIEVQKALQPQTQRMFPPKEIEEVKSMLGPEKMPKGYLGSGHTMDLSPNSISNPTLPSLSVIRDEGKTPSARKRPQGTKKEPSVIGTSPEMRYMPKDKTVSEMNPPTVQQIMISKVAGKSNAKDFTPRKSNLDTKPAPNPLISQESSLSKQAKVDIIPSLEKPSFTEGSRTPNQRARNRSPRNPSDKTVTDKFLTSTPEVQKIELEHSFQPDGSQEAKNLRSTPITDVNNLAAGLESHAHLSSQETKAVELSLLEAFERRVESEVIHKHHVDHGLPLASIQDESRRQALKVWDEKTVREWDERGFQIDMMYTLGQSMERTQILEPMTVRSHQALLAYWTHDPQKFQEAEQWFKESLHPSEGIVAVRKLRQEILQHKICLDWRQDRPSWNSEKKLTNSEINAFLDYFGLGLNFINPRRIETNAYLSLKKKLDQAGEPLDGLLQKALGKREADIRQALVAYIQTRINPYVWFVGKLPDRMKLWDPRGFLSTKILGLDMMTVLRVGDALQFGSEFMFDGGPGRLSADSAFVEVLSLMTKKDSSIYWTHTMERAWLVKNYPRLYPERLDKLSQLVSSRVRTSGPQESLETFQSIKFVEENVDKNFKSWMKTYNWKIGNILIWCDAGLKLKTLGQIVTRSQRRRLSKEEISLADVLFPWKAEGDNLHVDRNLLERYSEWKDWITTAKSAIWQSITRSRYGSYIPFRTHSMGSAS